VTILIVYATYSSGTQIAAELVDQILKSNGQEVTRKNASEVDPQEFAAYDLIIFGSPSWKIDNKEGQPHQYFIALLQKLEGRIFENKNFAIFGLGHSDYYIPFCGAVDILEQAIKKIRGKLLVDSLRIDRFYFNQKQNEEAIIKWTKQLLNNETV